MAKSIAADFVSEGVHCNAVSPGTIDTPALDGQIRALGGRHGEACANLVSWQPVGRLRRPMDLVAPALYFAGDESALVTGQAIPIDGGWSNV